MRQLFLTCLLMSALAVHANTTTTKAIEVQDKKESPFGESSLIFDAIDEQEPISYDSGELLDYFLGVNRIQNGGFSSLPSIQGLSDDRIKIKIDGMNLISSCANHMNAPLAYAVSSNIDEMSVVAGLSSVSQGGDNTGGVIKIESSLATFSSSQEWSVDQRAQSYFKSNNETIGVNYAATARSVSSSIRYHGSGVKGKNYHAGGDFKDAGQAASDRGYLAGDEVGSTQFKNTSHQLNLSKKIANDIYDLQLGYHHSPYESFANQRMDSVDNTSLQSKFSITSDYDWGNTLSTFYIDDTKHKHNFGSDKQYYYANGMMTSYGMPMKSEGKTAGLNIDTQIFLNDKDTLKTGIELQYYRLDDTFYASPTDTSTMMGPGNFQNINNGKRDRFDIYTQLDRAWSDEWLTSLGIRYGFVNMNADDIQGYSTTTNMMTNQVTDSTAFNNSDRSKTDHNIDLSLLAKYDPNELSNIEVGYTMKTRSPNVYQRYTWSTWTMAANMNNLYGDGNGYVGNVNLKPETAHKVGFLYNLKNQDKTWKVKVNPYYSFIEDFIDAVSINNSRPDGFRTLQFTNQDAYIYGFDVLAGADLISNSSFGAFKILTKINYQRGKNKDNDTNLYNLMPLNAIIALNHNYQRWANTLSAKIVDEKDRVDAQRLERQTAGYTIFDFKTSYSYESLQIDAGIDNILDKKYDDPLGGEYLGQGATMSTGIQKDTGTQVPGMGRSFNLSLTYNF